MAAKAKKIQDRYVQVQVPRALNIPEKAKQLAKLLEQEEVQLQGVKVPQYAAINAALDEAIDRREA